MVISAKASLDGNGALALGNVVGSNICSIALILGLSALIKPIKIHSRVTRLEVPVLTGASALLWLLLLAGTLSRLEGLLLTCALAGYLLFSYLLARKKKNKAVTEEFDESAALARPRHGIGLLRLVHALRLSGYIQLQLAIVFATEPKNFGSNS